MKISDVKIRLVTKEDSKLKAVVSLVIDDNLAIHDIKVIENEKGKIIAMPAKKTENGTYRDIIHPINSQTREEMTAIILKAYEDALNN